MIRYIKKMTACGRSFFFCFFSVEPVIYRSGHGLGQNGFQFRKLRLHNGSHRAKLFQKRLSARLTQTVYPSSRERTALRLCFFRW